ncbi:sigma-70 family RNA polymerase sigma factor [Mucilaginibacter sp. 44-25]|uniref:RNA polymerase sigma factor n=1 Tax=Mucilaginibacter sp. 44-25 TaxID=1895794 RepID=UPI00095A64B5|nr:sigma-70 family RNA polymerase sigma factor [Mucilaginibacter sp. 44-25]OJW18131.1 MAG: hypothetical protein BGO48_16290 [Mucilaginibacter sp. 44-25]
MMLSDEKELLFEVSRGNEHAFKELFSAYYQLLGTHIHRITESIELTEEVVQDSFLKIWLNRDALAGVNNFKAYLLIIAKNHALNCLRKLAREHQQHKPISIELVEDALADTDTSNNEYYSLLDMAIDHLPPQQQRVYLLSRHKRLKYDEIATQMGLSRETVKKYLQGATHSITSFLQSNMDVSIFIILSWIVF